MLEKIIQFSIKNKLIVVLFTLTIVGFGLYSIFHIPVGTVPDITNNQVQVITTSGNLSTQEIEKFITAPVEMEMANLPGVKEIRSISKFGISLVTVVFDEDMGTYLPRQVISEKIKSAAEKIPENYGTPESGPISTGLGEIYQYILDVKPGYEDRYTPMDLRTIQDWTVKRRLSGINGVVEVNSWGGYLKQYEISVNPSVLKSLNVDLLEIYQAVENNNNISGGAYIEKDMQSYFIRGDGQINSIDDIKNIRVKTVDGTPIYVRDVAEVKFGHANRFGAITANGKGETILGQVMMLKDANSKEVINAVKERVDEIQSSLPEGVYINPVLERGELISKTSFTVAENLILGALIVFLTVLLLLGNLRSALVIASMIPLALLFTISMMYIFGIDANLMSLGALDFGIIIDGAVIIVEYIVLRMGLMKQKVNEAGKTEKQALMDKISMESTTKMMKSAIFGQIIILIVFIPILTLRGVEGKMFQPMALAFSFAIIGAMIMGLTWLPVASSIFLKPEATHKKKNLSERLLEFLYSTYYPVIKWSCEHKRIVLSLALLSLISTGLVFSRMGGEFVPTLDEGDFVIQPVLKTGTSLSETIEMTTRMENILIKEFPDEVDQIVCRIGAAEVPTDPMSMEEIDMIIKLHPDKNWKKAGSKEDLAVAFKEALSIIPGIEYEFTQPIEMRFNELITGVRSDIAIKLYGEDLDYMNNKANRIKELIGDVPGATDIIVEKTTGLPQIKVEYDRKKIALYGVDINTLNTYLSTAFGGAGAGIVFEGEKRFDIVLRLQDDNRKDIEDIRTLPVRTSSGDNIPLSEFAEITYTKGPAKISRDNTQRRVVVSVNVGDRDLQSVIDDIRNRVDPNIDLQPGYYIEYGGQFENLQSAVNRLLIAVPVSLALIFIFLHFAFRSLKEAILIFTAIPLATVGGVFLLWIRGMPFSVSAGVGFIALFGIAVLNGIVLIEHFRDLRKSGITDMRELIITGTKDRLRPVLLTAGAAATGFLPMAVSTGAGAEVQRPLATVVIGGLVTSTMLTMIALPLLYEIFIDVKKIKLFPFRLIKSKATTTMLLFLLLSAFPAFAENEAQEVSLKQLIEAAKKNNAHINACELRIEQADTEIGTAYDIPKTALSYETDQNNIAENGYPLNVLAIEQQFDFPAVYKAKADMKRIEYDMSVLQFQLEQNKILKEISILYCKAVELENKIEIYQKLDSIYESLTEKYEQRLSLKDAKKLEYMTIKSKRSSIALKVNSLSLDYNLIIRKLKQISGISDDFTVSDESSTLPPDNFKRDSVAAAAIVMKQKEYARSRISVVEKEALPDFSLNYFLGTNQYDNADYYHGFGVGISVPVFYGSRINEIRAAKVAGMAQEQIAEYEMKKIRGKIDAAETKLKQSTKQIKHFHETEIPLASEIKRTSLIAYRLKEIDYLHLTGSLEAALQIELNYYELLFEYKKNYFELMYFSN